MGTIPKGIGEPVGSLSPPSKFHTFLTSIRNMRNLAERVGFEPTGEFPHALFSRQACYDRFSTPPKEVAPILYNLAVANQNWDFLNT